MKDAVDNSSQPYTLALTIGERVRLFDRVHDAGQGGRDKVLANNGSIVEVVDLTAKGMVIRNAAGETGTVLWSKLHKRSSDPIRLTYGYAMTRNLAQGITSSEHIDVPLETDQSRRMSLPPTWPGRGTRCGPGRCLNESAIRRDIVSKLVDGTYQPITPADVLRRAADDMSRKPERGSALDMLDRVTDRQRGSLVGFQRTMEPVERQLKVPG